MITNIDLNKVFNGRYTLIKKRNYAIVYKKFLRRYSLDKKNELLSRINNEYINIFEKEMYSIGKEKYLENFYSNLSNSKIVNDKKHKKKFLDKDVFGGNFYTKRNLYLILGDKEDLIENKEELTPFHELLHLITTRFTDNNTIRIGIQFNNFAAGINEGYTELLTKRYFGKYSKDLDFEAYLHFTWIVEMLEEIIGKEKLEELYFSSNLEGFILELEKYLPRETIFELIEDIDLLFNSEEELFEYQREFFYEHKKIDCDEVNSCYEVNKELLDRIYNKIIDINERKEEKLGFKTNFKEINDRKKELLDKEEEFYREYFIDNCENSIKR